MALDADDRLQLDYDQTQQLLRTLTDIRFKLLAFVPTIAGASVGFFGTARPAAELMAIGLVGSSPHSASWSTSCGTLRPMRKPWTAPGNSSSGSSSAPAVY